MAKPRSYIQKLRGLFRAGSFREASLELNLALQEFPEHKGILLIAGDIYRELGDCERSLVCSEQLIEIHPKNWKGYVRASQDLMGLQRFELSRQRIEVGLGLWPNQKEVLLTAGDIYRELGDYEKSLDCAESLINNYPEYWEGYVRASRDLMDLRRFELSKERIEVGLERCPNQKEVLLTAGDVYRELGDYEKSLDCAESLIKNYPGYWKGYVRASRDLMGLQRLELSKERIEVGLDRCPNQKEVLLIAGDLYRELGDYEKSLGCAEELIESDPENWKGYLRASRDLMDLQRFELSKQRAEVGLERFPNQKDLLLFSIDLFLSIGDVGQAWKRAEELIVHHPECWMGFGKLCKREQALIESLEDCQSTRLDKIHAKIGSKIYSKGIHGAYSFLNPKSGLIPFCLPHVVKHSEEESFEFPSIGFLEQMCTPPVKQVEVDAVSLHPLLVRDHAFLVFYDCLVTSAPGVHAKSGVPYLNSLITRGKCTKYAHFPAGFHSVIDQEKQPASGRTQLDIAVYIQFAEIVHFGHFLTETISSLSYLLFLKSCGSLPDSVPIIIPPQKDERTQKRCVLLLSDILGVDESSFIVKGERDLEVKYLISSSPTLALYDFVSPNHSIASQIYADCLGGGRSPELESSPVVCSKIYISRSKLNPKKRSFCEEVRLEEELSRFGWHIFYPEEYSLRDQISVYSQAEFICGCEGSAFHVLYCIRVANLAKVVLLSRAGAKDFTMQFKNQEISYDVIPCLEFDRQCCKVGANRNVTLQESFSVSGVVQLVETCCHPSSVIDRS